MGFEIILPGALVRESTRMQRVLTLCALNARPSASLLILIHLIPIRRRAPPLPVVRLLQQDLVDVSLFRKLRHLLSRWKSVLKQWDRSDIDGFGEFDIDPDVELSWFVVTEGWHPLARNDLECA